MLSRTICTSILLLLASIGTAGAQGFILPDGSGTISLSEYRADVDVQEAIASFSTHHIFHNPGPGTVQGIFYFPLPKDAQVTEFALHADGKVLQGELLEADAARKIYTDIVRKHIDPALLEMLGNDTFRASIFPIPPGQDRRIDVKFSTILPQENELVKLVLPMRGSLRTEGQVIARPQPVPGPFPHPRERPQMQYKPRTETAERPLRLIEISLNSSVPLHSIYSPSHKIELRRQGDRRATVSYEARERLDAGDFVLYYAQDLRDVSLRALAYRDDRSQSGFFSLLVSPRIARSSERQIDKDIIFVVDVSGSMAGEKIVQARESLRYCITNLNDGDRFNVITFSSGVSRFRERLASARAARQEALAFVDRIEARGGTNIHEALTTALQSAGSSENALIVFLTDGKPTSGITDEQQILAALKEHNHDKVRIFTFGIGYDVNTRLLDGFARETRAFSDYISPDENLEERITGFYDKMRYPALTEVRLDFGSAQVQDFYPRHLPDLFKGQQLVLFGRYQGSGDFTVRLQGRAEGRTVTFSQRISLPRHQSEHAFIAPLWASRKIGYLLEEIALNGESKELKDEVIELSKAYGIVTPYTSYLAQEDVAVPEMTMIPGRGGEIRLYGVSGRAPAAPNADGISSEGAAMSTARESVAVESRLAGVEQSRARNALKKASSLESRQGATRLAGGRQFRQDADGYWVDAGFDAQEAKLHLTFGSDAYFTLLQAYPELAPVLALGEKLRLVHKGKMVQIDTDGRATITSAELQKFFE